MGKKKVTHGSTNNTAILVLVCFFLSGLTGLIYEILWTRMIVKVIGGAPFAVSIVLTIFMGGLGLGSYLAGRRVDRIENPARLIRIYGFLELIIGGYALLVPVLLAAFKPLYSILYNGLYSEFMLYNVLTFIGCSIILCVPVVCMGATLPVLCRYYVTNLSYLGARAGRLYGLNTVGAAAGALLCGFWLIGRLGMSGTLIFAVVINCIVAVAAILAGSGAAVMRAAAGRESATDAAKEQGSALRGVRAGALVIFGVSGFCAMAYEVIWTRLLGLIVGPTTYSFTVVLVTFILGLALGSMFFGWLADRTKRPAGLLIGTQIAAALLVLTVSQLMGDSQLFFAKLIYDFREQFWLLSFWKAGALFAFMILPTLCLGATFPLVGKIYTRSLSKVGSSIGLAYAVNTLGAVLGSFCAGFLLIPLLGKETSLGLVVAVQLTTSLSIGAGIIIWRALQMGRRRDAIALAPLAAAGAAGLVLCLASPSWNHQVLSSGKYHRFHEIEPEIRTTGWAEALIKGPEILMRSERSEVVYYGDGIGGFTTVLKYNDPLGGGYYSMTNSGKMDASSRGDMQTQTLLAHFPMLFHAGAKKVMVLGLASGITAGEVLCYPVEQLDVLEISPVVQEGSGFFIEWNNNVLADARTRLIIQDARAHLALTREKYDVIISEPSNPWMAGLATLFTRDFFSLTYDRLNDGGIFVQFLHSYEMDWPTFSVVGRAFADVFGSSALVLTEPAGRGGDYLFVGLKGKRQLILNNAQQNLKYAQRSKNIVLRDARLLYRFVVSEDLKRLFGVGLVNSDDRPILEFTAPKLMYTRDPTIEDNIRLNQRFSFVSTNIMRQVARDIDAQIDFAEYAFSVHAPFSQMVDLSRADTAQKERFFRIFDNYCSRETIDISILTDRELLERCCAIQVRVIENNIDKAADKAFSYRCLADLYLVQGTVDKAIENYLNALQIEPRDGAAHFNLGLALSRQGRLDEAIAQIDEAVQIRPAFKLRAHRSLGRILSAERPEQAAKQYQQYLALEPTDAQVHYQLGKVLAQLGRLDSAIEHFRQAIRLKPDFSEALENLRYAQTQRVKLSGQAR